ncbi:hypothetical protein ACGTN6_08085 [Halomonas sp. THAF12]|uniref:hypothetical protein n=1 Tax=Halomonas sp. B23F22_10 TaxID=3459515 RepID=UPI00373E2BC5
MNQVLLLTHTPIERRPYHASRLARRAERIGQRFRKHPGGREKVEVGCLSHAPHEELGPVDLANARRRLDFYSRWHGLTEPHLQIWRAP